MNAHAPLWLFSALEQHEWWQALRHLDSLGNPGETERETAYARLFRALLAAGHDSIAAALAHELLAAPLPLPAPRLGEGSLLQALERDLALFNRLAAQPWAELAGSSVPALDGLGPARETGDELLAGLTDRLQDGTLGSGHLLAAWRERGRGPLALGLAFSFRDGRLERLKHVRRDSFAGLYGLDRQVEELTGAVEPWLEGRPPVNILLYGPRGSGKSTAARSLLQAYAARGLRLVELPPAELARLPALLEEVADSPLRFVLFIDDLGFSGSGNGWQDLKTVLDGTLTPRPANVLLLATTNRRTLVPQRFSDRPDPLDDDANAWDTQDEKLALADRFGLVVTFPSADQRRYLHIVAALARERGLADAGLEAEALLFARRHNGFSGRTARQFIDARSA